MSSRLLALGASVLVAAPVIVLSAVPASAGPASITDVCSVSSSSSTFTLRVTMGGVHGQVQTKVDVGYGPQAATMITDVVAMAGRSPNPVVTSEPFPATVEGQAPVMVEISLQRVRGDSVPVKIVDQLTRNFSAVTAC